MVLSHEVAELEEFLPLVTGGTTQIIQGSFSAPADGNGAHPQPSCVCSKDTTKINLHRNLGKMTKRGHDTELLCRCCRAAHPIRMRFLCYLPAWEKQQPHIEFLATVLGLSNVFCHSSSFRVIFVPAREGA